MQNTVFFGFAIADGMFNGDVTIVRQVIDIDEVRRCIRDGGPKGLIVSSSNTIHRGVKPANYQAMLDALREFGTFDSDANPHE